MHIFPNLVTKLMMIWQLLQITHLCIACLSCLLTHHVSLLNLLLVEVLAILTATDSFLQVSPVNSTPHIEVQSHDQITMMRLKDLQSHDQITMTEGSPVSTTQPQSGMGNYSVDSCKDINTP